MVQLSHIIHYVSDIQKAVTFYSKTFGFNCTFIHESGCYAEMNTGGCTLAFASFQLAEHNFPKGFQQSSLAVPPFATQISLTTEYVQQLYDKAITSGAVSVKPPEQKPWGQVCAYIRDPFGFVIEIASPLDKSA